MGRSSDGDTDSTPAKSLPRTCPVLGGSAELAEQVANDYDSFAEAYSASNETSLFNAYYERPAMLGLVGEVAGRRILDAGCGPLSAALRDRGAIVTGFDSSAEILELARKRLGEDAAPAHRRSAQPAAVPRRSVRRRRRVPGRALPGAQGGELGLDAVEPGVVGRGVGELDVVGRGPVADLGVLRRGQVRGEVVEQDRDTDLRRVELRRSASENGSGIRLLSRWRYNCVGRSENS
jgi:SAM-dependent methyltransferase